MGNTCCTNEPAQKECKQSNLPPLEEDQLILNSFKNCNQNEQIKYKSMNDIGVSSFQLQNEFIDEVVSYNKVQSINYKNKKN